MKKRNRIRQILSLMLALALFMSSVPVSGVAYAAELTSEVEATEADATTDESSEAASSEADKPESESAKSDSSEEISEDASEEASSEEISEADESAKSETKEESSTEKKEDVVEDDIVEVAEVTVDTSTGYWGPTIGDNGEVTIYYYGTGNEKTVCLKGSWNGWGATPNMSLIDAGKVIYTYTLSLADTSTGFEYGFLVDDEWKHDLNNGDGSSNSIVKRNPEITENKDVTLFYYPKKHGEYPNSVILKYKAADADTYTEVEMNRNAGGNKIYSKTISNLPLGNYVYEFVVDGESVVDKNTETPGEFSLVNYPEENPDVKSPVIDKESKEVTFNYYGPTAKTVVLAGSMFNNWGYQENMTKNEETAYWSFKGKIPAGSYEYKFIVNGKYIGDPLNLTDGNSNNNSKFVIEGLKDATATVEIGKSTELPATLECYDSNGNATDAAVTYALADAEAAYKDKVSITKDEETGKFTLALTADFPADVTEFELTATDVNSNTATVKVTVVAEMYNYTIYYYDEVHATGADKAMTTADADIWFFETGKDGKAYDFSTAEKLADGKTWAKAVVSVPYTDVTMIPRSKGGWTWQHTPSGVRYDNKEAVKDVTIYLVYGDNTVYTELPEVKEMKDRYIVVEYTRTDDLASKYCFRTWNNGFGTNFYPFEEKDGKYIATVPVMSGIESVSYNMVIPLIKEDGTMDGDWGTKDGEDHCCEIPADQTVVKIKMEEGKGITYTYPYNIGYEFDAENKEIDFYYRDDNAFLAGSTGGAYSVQVEVDGKAYDMTFDENEQRYEYSLKDLKDATYKYRYLVKKTEESQVQAYLDAYNTATVKENGVEYSTCKYGKYNIDVTAKMHNATMDYNQNNVLSVKVAAKDDTDISELEISKVTADLTALGGSSEFEIDPELMEGTISLKQGIAAGEKKISVTVYDQYSNPYEAETTVTVVDRNKGKDFDWDEAVVYFTVTDRFFDGNTSNNGKGYDVSDKGSSSYHGGDFAGLTQKLDYLNELGVNTIWITPIVANDMEEGLKTDVEGIKSWGYHGYWASDFESLDSHLGTEEEFKKLLDEAHARGMKIMVDVVLNHAGYDNEKIFNDKLEDGDMIRTSAQMISGDDQKSSLSGLPDFVTENPEVRALLVEWQSNWISKYPIDYYRVDTVKHVDSTTWSAFKNALTKIKPEFKLIGEQYGASYTGQAGQLESGKMDSLLDFAFKGYAYDFVAGKITSVEGTLADRNTKLSNTATMGGFLGSHDENGFIFNLEKDGKTPEEAEALMKVAATLQITAKGQPVIYYGEEIGLSGENNYPYQTNRYDFDWSKADAQKKDENSMLNHYTKLLNIRKDYSEVFAKGDRRAVMGSDALGYDIIRRSYNDKNVYVAMNVKNAAVEATFDATAGAVYTDLYSNKTYTATENGKVTITIPSVTNGGTAILVTDANEVVEDTNTITLKIHYNRPDGDYTDLDVWSWANSLGGNGYAFADENGEKVATIQYVGRTTTSIGYIVRKFDWSYKDVDADQFIDVTDVVSGTLHLYVESGVPNISVVYGPDVILGNKLFNPAYNQKTNTITFTSAKAITEDITKAFKVKCLTDGTEIGIKEVTADNLTYAITLDKDISGIEDLAKTYVVVFEGYDYRITLPSIYQSEAFEKAFTYTGSDLGATWGKDATTFKVWAPTAESVKVALYKSGTAGTDDKLGEYPMTLGEAGVWSLTLDGNHEGKYYTYLVNVENKVVEACDPYARTTGVNGKRAMIIDLESTNPEGWDMDKGPHTGMNYTDAVIYELHVRDASIHESSGVSDAHKGKYLGLTETGTKTNGGVATALDHIKDLGVTHVQLLPVYDYGSVDETKLDQPQFNWGYDPANYNVPEGSYSTNPYNGEVRVGEFKQMVKTMHDNNINVVMDVVYNHVYSADDFCFNQIVPKYFSRTNEDGSYTSASGCGNDTASERAMVRKYIVDSVLYWAKEYHIDGFRFDLVGLIDAETMNAVITEVHKYDPDIIFYGEGWDMKPVPEGKDMAIMQNAKLIPELAFFSDTFRNNVAGSHMDSNDIGFVSGGVGKENAMGKCVTADTDWCPKPTQTVNYASCHDNYTLKDKLNIKAKDATEEERIKMNNLTAAMYMMSEGIPFIHAGEEFLRTKVNENGDVIENSYNSSDYVNAIRWNNLEDAAYADVADYYKGLIEFRKNHKVLRLTTSEEVAANVEYKKLGDSLILFKLKGKSSVAKEASDGIVMIFNANKTAKTVDLAANGITGDWNVCINGEDSGIETLATVNGTVEVAAISALVMVQGASKDSGTIYDENVVEKPVNVTAITNIHTTLEDVALVPGWSWKYKDIPVAAFAGSSTKNFQAVYTDKDGKTTETEIPVRIITVSKANIASALDVVEAGKALNVTAGLVTVGGNVPAGMVTAEWSVSDESIATVNASNMNAAVTGVAAGKATVTVKVTVKDGDKSAEFTATKAIKVIDTELAQIAVKEITNAKAEAGVYKAAYGEALTIVVTSKSSNVTIKSSDAKVVKVGKVSKTEAGDFTATLEVKKAGYVKLTAVANDEVKSQTSVDLYVKDATPIILTKSIELNKKSTKTAAVYVYANEDFAVESVGIDSEAFTVTRVGESARFEIAVNSEKKDEAKTGNYNLVIKMAGVETAVNSPIKIKVTDKLPKVTVKQTKKINTFYTDAEANGKIAVTSTEKIANVTLTDCGYDYDFVTGEVRVSQAEGADATDKSGILHVYFEGYDEAVTKNITIKTEDKAPVLKLSAKSGTIYPNANINSTVVSVYDTTTGKGIAKASISVSDECKEIYDVDPMDNAVKFTVKAGATAAKATAKITVNKANYSKPVELTYSIKVSNSIPKVVLSQKSVTLNKNAAVKDKESTVVNVSVKGVPVSAITALEITDVTSGIKVNSIGNALVVNFDNEAPATGSYKINVVAKNGEFAFASVPLTVKVIDKEPTVKLSKSGKIDVLNRANTSMVYKTKLSNVTGRVVDAKLTGRFAHLFRADVVNGNVVVTLQKNAKVITKYNYEVGFELTLSNGVELTAGTQNIKLTQGKPKVTAVPSDAVVFNTVKNSSSALTFNAVNKDGSEAKIDRIELTNFTNAFAYDKGTGKLTLVGRGEVVKGKTYTLKFNVYCKGAADNEKPVTVTYKVKVN